ncbi:MAG: hypothetical protein ACYCVL_00025 [Gemmatimonadaceae bacterium]
MPKTLWSVAAAVMLLPRGAVAQAAPTPRAAIRAVLDQQMAAANAHDSSTVWQKLSQGWRVVSAHESTVR